MRNQYPTPADESCPRLDSDRLRAWTKVTITIAVLLTGGGLLAGGVNIGDIQIGDITIGAPTKGAR